jgi:hypothetical protein
MPEKAEKKAPRNYSGEPELYVRQLIYGAAYRPASMTFLLLMPFL